MEQAASAQDSHSPFDHHTVTHAHDDSHDEQALLAGVPVTDTRSLSASVPTRSNNTSSAASSDKKDEHRTELQSTSYDAYSITFGLALVVVSSAAFAVLSLLVSISTTLGIPAMQTAITRFSFQLIFSAVWIAFSERGHLMQTETWLGKASNRRLLVQRGIIGAFSMCCLFYTVSTIPLADATCIAFLNVPITAAVAACFLGERYSIADGIAALVSAIGVILVVQPSFLFGSVQGHALPWLSVCTGLLYSVLSALVFVTIRAIGPGENALVLVFYFGVTGVIVAPILLAALQTPSLGIPGNELAIVGAQLGVGLFGFIGQVLVSRGMQLAPAGASSVRHAVVMPDSTCETLPSLLPLVL